MGTAARMMHGTFYSWDGEKFREKLPDWMMLGAKLVYSDYSNKTPVQVYVVEVFSAGTPVLDQKVCFDFKKSNLKSGINDC